MCEVVWFGCYEIMFLVLVVVEWVYLEWVMLFEDCVEDLLFWFGEWIILYCGVGFEGVVGYLCG